MEYIQNLLSGQVGQGVLNLLLALFILIVGWIVARIIARIVRGLLKRTDLDNRLASYLVDPDEERVINIEDIFGKVVFWLLMLFVLAAFFQQLGLAQIATPISVFLQRLTTDYLPRFGGAALLTGIAWLVATVLRFLVKKLVSLTRLDERMSEHGALEEGEKVTFGDSLATAVFWFVLLLFLPSILTALGIGSIADQFKVIFDQIFAYIPSILAAAVVFLIGLFLARAIRLIVANLLKSIGTDKFGQQVGLKEERSLSDLIASLIYMFVLLVIIAA
ncbi:MAG: mechanosensitive ion channel family protein, partial [Anaerolineales bacterium]